ncbi:MAG TPA: class I SAM-dependent rRNA methyltransferase [Opitutaceae bacterium]|nr:class I SAM-dependent rRNA methyltransferase [Opitutaceae bacterium]
METPSLRLKHNAAARALRGHPWVFGNEVETLLPPALDGEAVDCRDARGRLLGSGVYNSRSQIAWRRFSREHAAFDEAFVRGALERAIARREALEPAANGPVARRLVWSESDDLPGVVVDQFGDVLVVQTQTLAAEKRLETILTALNERLRPAEIIVRNDAPIRRLEGLPAEVRTFSGRAYEPRWVAIGGMEYWLDLAGGQKTGFYLDQTREHAKVARHAAGRRVLDCFCNQGSFALHAAKAGATRVLGLDSSEEAIGLARRNAEHNGVRGAEFSVVNVFDYLAEKDETQWDVIVLDPPPFARSKSALKNALRGYKEINLRAMKRLVPGGVLATYSCSHHVTAEVFRDVIAEAAHDAKRKAQVLEFSHQPPDHPVLVTMPESEYLRGYILRIE